MSDKEAAAPAPSEAPIDAQEILKKFDKESDYRSLTGLIGRAVSALAIAFTLFQLYTAVFGVFDAMIQRSIHLAFGLCLVYLLYPTSKKWPRDRIHPIDAALAVLAAGAPIYIVIFYQSLVQRAGTATPLDMAIGVVGILLVLEAARRVVGVPIVAIALLFVAYAFAGPYIPGKLAHRGAHLETLVGHLFYTTEGVFGIPIGVSSTFIFLFILFGAYLERTGLGQLFIDMANAVAGWAAGGPAKVAVLSSALMGTVSGSSVANVVGTGSFTIPMMKKLGYKGEFAGAVEATASTGGQLMPPIMGAAAFLMAEFTEIPYRRIIGAAAIPALLYYFGVWSGVHFEAKKLGLKGIPREELPKFKRIFLERGHLIIPLAAIIYLLVAGFTPMKAALWAIILSIVSSWLRKSTRIPLKEIVGGLEAGARGALGIISATACAGVIIGVVTQTGLGLKLGSILVDAAGGMLLPTLFFTMITSLILGMGVPTTANYVITSTITAPAVIMIMARQAGLGPGAAIPAAIILPAHMFAFYFGIIADVTPPVALAAFAGAGIAKANPMKTGVNASKLAIAAFLVPYIFVINPQMLLFNVEPVGLVWMIISSLAGMTAVAAGVGGWFLCRMSWYERIAAFVGGVLLVDPGLMTDAIGSGLMLLVLVLQIAKKRRDGAGPAAA
ncbi:MAG TPA: TRAP transporter permease [Spirochaetia bacterium]|nr:TRAP transporter permease [Spirochaetia bacterium]